MSSTLISSRSRILLPSRREPGITPNSNQERGAARLQTSLSSSRASDRSRFSLVLQVNTSIRIATIPTSSISKHLSNALLSNPSLHLKSKEARFHLNTLSSPYQTSNTLCKAKTIRISISTSTTLSSNISLNNSCNTNLLSSNMVH